MCAQFKWPGRKNSKLTQYSSRVVQRVSGGRQGQNPTEPTAPGAPLPPVNGRKPASNPATAARRLASLELIPPPPDKIRTQAEKLASKLELDAAMEEVLDCLIRICCVPEVQQAFDLYYAYAGSGDRAQELIAALSLASALPLPDVRSAVDQLQRTGLIDSEGHPAPFIMRVADGDDPDTEAALSLISRATPTELTLYEDFNHVRHIRIAADLLAGAIRECKPGIHLLLTGASGVGKSTCARVLAKEVGAELVEITQPAGKPCENARFEAWVFAGEYLSRKCATPMVLLVDEEKDADDDNWSWNPFMAEGASWPRKTGRRKRYQGGDAEQRRCLETAPLPTIWIAGSDKPDLVLPITFQYRVVVPPLPAGIRARILSKHTNEVEVRPQTLMRLAQDARVTAPEVETAAKAVQLCGYKAGAEQTLLRVLSSNLGFEIVPPDASPELGYDIRYVRADVDLGELVQALKTHRAGRVLFHGVPGTGKTALAAHIADVLGCRLMVAPASALLSKWFGETEKNTSRIFAEARRENAVLLLDEADSFLHPRSRATYTWQISQVNELLVNMEKFEGVLLVATNDGTGLDEAAARRFDAKVQLLPPDSEQRWALFVALLSAAGIAMPNGGELEIVRVALTQCTSLTPGDFVAVRRRLRLVSRELTLYEIVELLHGEQAWKKTVANETIGFGRIRRER